jgi:hypothetical protein
MLWVRKKISPFAFGFRKRRRVGNSDGCEAIAMEKKMRVLRAENDETKLHTSLTQKSDEKGTSYRIRTKMMIN